MENCEALRLVHCSGDFNFNLSIGVSPLSVYPETHVEYAGGGGALKKRHIGLHCNDNNLMWPLPPWRY